MKICPRCRQAFNAKYDFYRYCEECFVPCQIKEIIDYDKTDLLEELK